MLIFTNNIIQRIFIVSDKMSSSEEQQLGKRAQPGSIGGKDDKVKQKLKTDKEISDEDLEENDEEEYFDEEEEEMEFEEGDEEGDGEFEDGDLEYDDALDEDDGSYEVDEDAQKKK